MQIGPYRLKNNLMVAPMAGVTDRPFRQLCKVMGAGMAVSEMVSSNSLLWGSEKTRRRANHEGEVEPKSVQIAGADPAMMAEAARYNVDQGAQIIDINMGCPAKGVQRHGGLCLAAERSAGAAHRRGRGGRRSGAGHPQDSHRLGPHAPQCPERGTYC
jgi:tRNA-dihydrouridine synthase